MNMETGEIKGEGDIRAALSGKSKKDIITDKDGKKWIMLDHLPDPNCKKGCHGTGKIGKDMATGLVVPCACLGLRVQRIALENMLSEIKRLEAIKLKDDYMRKDK